MAIQTLQVTITGVNPLLQNNPQTVDHFNPLGRRLAAIHAKGIKRTDDDYRETHNLEIEAKIHWCDELGIIAPTQWVTESIVSNAYGVLRIAKKKMRGGIFATEERAKLLYRDLDKVKGREDIIKNGKFRIMLTLPQNGNRICKAFPIFHDWSFTTNLEFDDKVIDFDSLKRVLEYGAKYNGYGDFRPTFGRARAEVTSV